MGNLFSSCWPGGGETITIEDVTVRVDGVLGQGAYSDVYSVHTVGEPTTRHLALKRQRCGTPELEAQARVEVDTMRRFASEPRILRLHAASEQPLRNGFGSEWLLLMDRHPRTVQHWVEGDGMQWGAETKRILEGVCEGLLVFHRQDPPLAMRDLKPDNVLVAEDGEAVLLDFGSVAEARPDVSTRQGALSVQEHAEGTVTMTYRAPELFDVITGAVVHERTDVWALGCVFYCCAVGEGPFDRADSVKLAAVQGSFEEPTDRKGWPDAYWALVRRCLQTDPSERPFVPEVLEQLRAIPDG